MKPSDNANEVAVTKDEAAPKSKRAWSTPRVVATQQAFEHAILACNGLVSRPAPLPPVNAIHQNSGGACTNAATAFS